MTARFATPEDDALLTSIVMHPDCRAWSTNDVTAERRFSPSLYTSLVPENSNLAVVVNGGCFLLPALHFGAYQLHTNFLPLYRGLNAHRETAAMLHLMFTRTPAEQIVTMVADHASHVRQFAHQMGFRNTYRRERIWPVKGIRHGLQFMRLDIDDWIVQAVALRAVGQAFHEQTSEHDEVDQIHFAYVGAALEMIRAGHAVKAEWVYNRWARAAGYPTIEVLPDDATIVVSGMTIRVDPQSVHVIYPEEHAHA
jgi:hypothetical protein